MKDSFEELMELVKKSLKHDPWTRARGLKGYCKEIKSEAMEAIDAAEKEDYDNLREELGDVFLDWAHACMIAQEKNIFTAKDVIESVKQKLARRKPYLAENRSVSMDETNRIWTKAKKEEKLSKKCPKNLKRS